MSTLKQVLITHREICEGARALVERKGRDYNRKQQKDGDTLFNLTVCQKLGIVDHDTQGILVRLSDKFMRLCSLAANPTENPEIKNESVKDTIIDTVNYLVYLYIKYNEARSPLVEKYVKKELSKLLVPKKTKRRVKQITRRKR